jgi:hypothetical protein
VFGNVPRGRGPRTSSLARCDRNQVGDDFIERSAGIQLMRAALPEERLDAGEVIQDHRSFQWSLPVGVRRSACDPVKDHVSRGAEQDDRVETVVELRGDDGTGTWRNWRGRPLAFRLAPRRFRPLRYPKGTTAPRSAKKPQDGTDRGSSWGHGRAAGDFGPSATRTIQRRQPREVRAGAVSDGSNQ